MRVDQKVISGRKGPAPEASITTGESSFEDFYSLEFERIYCAAFAFCGHKELALDATQEAFSKAFARWKRLSKEPWVAGWVMTTAMNQCRRQGRSRRASPSGNDTIPAPSADRVDVTAALRSLAPRQRTAAILFYVGDLPIRAVAEAMNVSEGAVKAHLSKARDALRARLSPDEQEGSGP